VSSLNVKQDKSILLKQLSSIGNILLNATNMKKYQNEHFPHFYQMFLKFYENCVKLHAQCQGSWEKSHAINITSNDIKDLTTCLLNSILELRKDFFMAKRRFYSLYTANPNKKCDIISLCKHSIQDLQSVSSLLPQIGVISLTQDAIDEANFVFKACSDVSDGLIMLASDLKFSQDLSLFFEALYTKQQADLVPIIQNLLKGVRSILEEEMFLQSQRQLQGHIQSDRKEYFDVHFFVLLNFENWNFTDENFRVALHFYNTDQISSSNFVLAELKEKCAVMTAKVMFHKKYLGRKIYYKYWVFNPNVNLEELLYMHEAKSDDCNSCFRVHTLPTQGDICENSYFIYDPPVYPQQLKAFYQRWFSSTIFKEPDRKKEGEICFILYLSAYFTQKQLSHDDVNAFYSKLTRVYDSLMSSKKVNIYHKENYLKVLTVTGETSFGRILITESDKLLRNPKPQCILQYIVLCHFLTHHLKSLSGDFIDTILSSLQVTYDGDSLNKCSQYDIIIKFQHLDLIKKLIAEIFLAIGKCLLFPKSDVSLALFLKALPLYHWFVGHHPTEPFVELDVKPDTIKELIKSYEYLYSKKACIIQNILAKLNSSDLEGDAKLQAVLFVICPPAQYPVLLNYVSLPIILIGISMEMKSTDEKNIEKLLKEVKSGHACSGATEALSVLVVSLKGKIQKSSDCEGFSKLSHSLFQKLLAVIQHSQHCMISGISSVNLFKMIERRWNDHLCPILRLLKLHIDLKDFKKAMDSANNKIALFQFHEALLLNFVNYLDKGLQKDFEVCEISPLVIDGMRINELCVEDGEKCWKYPSLEVADPVKPLLIPCAIMTCEELKNDIFHQQCKVQVRQLNSSDTWSQIANAVEAAFESCTCILIKLRDETISLHEIDTLFRNKSYGVIVSMLSRLENALMLSKVSKNSLEAALAFSFQKPCSLSRFFTKSIKTTPASWINEVASSIALWKGVSPLLTEAKNFLDILHYFEVEPDEFLAFSEIDLETTEIKSVARRKEILEFMKKTNEQTREVKDSIRMFAENKELRDWILSKSEEVIFANLQKVAKFAKFTALEKKGPYITKAIFPDLNAMETFIGVVLDTLAEGGDEIQDKLTNLSELCSKFSSLIYHFDQTKTISLKKVFEDTYKKLSDLDDPVALVENCTNDFEWYKRIGELQGSIEQGAVTQMRNINQHGSYSIQSIGDSHECKVELSIVWDKEHLTLSIDDLNELESKLVLITRKNSAWADEKELFQEMLKRIILISESVQKLKDFGHLVYLDWGKKYHCSEYIRDLGSLDQEICTLESILVGWIYNVWSCRYQFPELNYYTTEQLIVLRKELTLTKNDPSKEVNPQVFYLLHSVVGEPVDSTMLLKKGLKCDEKSSIVNENDEEDSTSSSSIEVGQSADSLLSADDAVSLNASDTESISVLQEAIDNLNEEETEVYNELVGCGYDDYMSVEAAILHNDIYNAMEWCDKLDEKEEETFRNKYFSIKTTATSTNSISVSQDCSLTVSEQNPIKISVLPDFAHFDVTAIVSMFISSDIHSACNVLMDDKNMMSLNDLGDFLRTITELRERKQIKRIFSENIFEKGHPNLIITPADEIFNCVIQIYAEDEDAPLPCYEEILLCSSSTTLEQVVVFWMRALFDQNLGRIYCLVHAEKLSYLVADKAIDLLSCLSQGITNYRLVIVCSNESEGKSHILTRLNSFHRNWEKSDDSDILKRYLKKHLIPKTNDKNINASIIDEEKCLVRIIYSKQAAAGKSLHIRKMKDRLNAVLKERDLLISKKKPKVMLSIPLHGPDVTPDEVLKMLLAERNVLKSCIIHIDVPQQVLHSIDDILFSIIILQGLSDSRGQIWRCRSTHFYAIEMTIPSEASYIRKFTEARRALSLLHLVPNKECYQPLEMIGNIDYQN
uniref:Uncharacterized protein n=1 Tax=Amphimedon queenslandica TaxID=400682 RepID=A0A1X7TN16_AMPQE